MKKWYGTFALLLVSCASTTEPEVEGSFLEPTKNYYALVQCRDQYFYANFDKGDMVYMTPEMAVKMHGDTVTEVIHAPCSIRMIHRSALE